MLDQINWLAVLAAALVNFFIGGLWYSPALFGKVWMRANGFSEEDVKRGSPAAIFGLSFLFCLVMAVNLAGFLSDPSTTLGFGIVAGLLAGFGFAAMGLGVIAMFERRPPAYLWVNGGYLTVAFTAMGAILGGWR